MLSNRSTSKLCKAVTLAESELTRLQWVMVHEILWGGVNLPRSMVGAMYNKYEMPVAPHM